MMIEVGCPLCHGTFWVFWGATAANPGPFYAVACSD